MNYETIRHSNNQTYRFAGITASLRTTSGETIRVDNEGTVKDSNQTNQTIGRTAIGGVVGAGAGAGSVYIQERDDLELQNCADFTIRASSPRAN